MEVAKWVVDNWHWMCKIYKKLEVLSKILEDFLQNWCTSHQNIVYIDIGRGVALSNPPIAALDAIG